MRVVTQMEAAIKRRSTQIWVETDQLIDRLAKRFQVPAEALILAEGRRAARAFHNYGLAAALDAPSESIWADYLVRVWVVVAPESAALVERFLMQPEKAVDPVSVAQAARAQLLRVLDAKTRALVDTSRETIRQAVEGREDIMRAVGQRAPERSRRIARTESHESANNGSYNAARGLRRVYDKVWIATPDERVRDAHMEAHKQRRKLDANFTVGGETLMYPGDSTTASIGNTINCRCVLSYQAKVR